MAENIGVATASMKLYADSNGKDFGEIINQAIDIHTKKAIQGLEFDKTETAEIVDISNAVSGDYVVFNGSTRYHAYSNDTGYTLGTKVCILIPNSDYAQQKLILNKVRRSSSDTIVDLNWPLDEYESETPDLFEFKNGKYTYGADDVDIQFLNKIFNKDPDNNYYYKDENQLFYYEQNDKEYGPIYEGSLSKIAYGYKRIGENNENKKVVLSHLKEKDYDNENGAGITANESNIIENGTTIKSYPEYTLLFMSKDLTILNDPETGESLFNRNSRRMGLRARFKSDIDVYKNITAKSEYALDIIVLYSIQILGNSERTYALKSYRLSSKNMVGNVFYLTNYARQEALFDLYQDDKNDFKIHRIGVLLYQNGEFQRNGNNGAYYIIPEKKEEEYVKNIFVSNISLTLGNAKIDRDIDEVSLYSASGIMYDSTVERDADISKKIQLKWVHKNPDGDKKSITSLRKEIECGTSGAKPTVTWYRDYAEDFENYKMDVKKEMDRYNYLQSILDLYNEAYPNYYNWVSEWIKIQSEKPDEDPNTLWTDMWAGIDEKNPEEKEKRDENRAKLNTMLPDLIAAFNLKDKEYYYDESNKTIVFSERGLSKIEKGISEESIAYKQALKNVDKGGQGWIPIELEDPNTMSIKFVPDRKVNQCSVKCVIEYGPKIYENDLDIEEEDREHYDTTSPYYTKIETEPIVFYNQNNLPDAATLDASIGLEFSFNDGSKGNYPIYDYSGRLFEPKNATVVRKLSVDLKSKKKGTSYINGNEKIIWKFPKSDSSQRSTMINFSSSMEDDPDFVIPKEEIKAQFNSHYKYSQGNKIFCYIRKLLKLDREDIVQSLGEDREGVEEYITRYYVCLKDYEAINTSISPLNNREYWEEYELAPEFKIVYPNHKTTKLDNNSYIFTEYAEDIPYDDNYYYIMCEALSKNTSFYRKKFDDQGQFAGYQFVVPNEEEKKLVQKDSPQEIETIVSYDDCIPIPARKYFKYQIKENFSPSVVSNNKITCYLIKNNMVFQGSTTLFFGNKGNNGTDYTVNFGLGDLVEPISGPIIDDYLAEKEGESSNNVKYTINLNNIYEVEEWKEVQMPTGVLTLGETGFHKIVFSILDPDGEQINLTNKQKNDIIKLWINGEDEGYYSGQANYDNLSFLCKYIEEDGNKYYTDVAVRANTNIKEVKDLNFISLQLEINTINPETGQTDNTDNINITSSGRSHDLTNINLISILPLNVRENSEYQMAGSNFIYYNDSGQLINKGYTEYSLNDITKKANYEEYIKNFESLQTKLNEIEEIEKGKTKKQLLYKELEKIYKAVNYDSITEAELVEVINEHFPLLSESIGKIDLKTDDYHIDGDLKEIKKNLYKHLEQWITIYNKYYVLETSTIEDGEDLNDLEVFQNNPLGLKETGVWTENSYKKVIDKLRDLGAIFINSEKSPITDYDNINYGSTIKGFINSSNKQKVKDAISKAKNKNKSDWNKKQDKYKKTYGKQIKDEKDAYTKWKNGYNKIIKDAETKYKTKWNKCLNDTNNYSSNVKSLKNSKTSLSENNLNIVLKSFFDLTDSEENNIANIIRRSSFSKEYEFFDYEVEEDKQDARKEELIALESSLAKIKDLETRFKTWSKSADLSLSITSKTEQKKYKNYLEKSLAAIRKYKELQLVKIKLLYGYHKEDEVGNLYLQYEENGEKKFAFVNNNENAKDLETVFNTNNAVDIVDYLETDPDSEDNSESGTKFDFDHASLKCQITQAKYIFNILNEEKLNNLTTLEGLEVWKNDKVKYEEEAVLLQYCSYLLQTNGIVPESSLFSLEDFLEALDNYIIQLAEINNDKLTKNSNRYELEKSSNEVGLLNTFIEAYEKYVKKEDDRNEHYKVIVQTIDTNYIPSAEDENKLEPSPTFGEYIDAYIEPEEPVEPIYPDIDNLTGDALINALDQYEQDKKKYYEDKAIYDDYKKICSYYPSFGENQNKLTVSPICIDGLLKEVAINCMVENKAIYTMPLVIIKNSSTIPVIEKWNNKVTQDDDGNSIYSAVLSAGSINDNNKYSGVIVGAIGNSEDTSEYTSQNKNAINGIYGYHEGVQSFGILTDGTSFLGKPGTGRIEFDGNRGVIKSASYIENGNDGTCIDLKEGDIDLRNATKNIHIHLGSKYVDYKNDADDGNYFNITVPSTAKKEKENVEEGEELLENIGGENSLINIGESSYYLQTADYAENSVSGLRIDLTDGSFSSKGKFNVTAGEDSSFNFGGKFDLKAAEGSSIKFGQEKTEYGKKDSFFGVDGTGKVTCTGIEIINCSINQLEGVANGKVTGAQLADAAIKWQNYKTFQIQDNDNSNSGPISEFVDGSPKYDENNILKTDPIVLQLPAIIKADLEGNANSATQWKNKKIFKIQDSATTPHDGQEIEIDGSEEGDIILKLPSTIKATLEGNADSATVANKIKTTVNNTSINLIPEQKTIVTNIEINAIALNGLEIGEGKYLHFTTETVWVLKQE